MIAVLGTQDTKASESAYVASHLQSLGLDVEIVDTNPSKWTVPIPQKDRAETLSLAAEAIRDYVLPLIRSKVYSGVLILAGASGAALTSKLLAEIPYGTPSVLVSPVASSHLRPYIGSSDTVIVSTIVDYGGRNAYMDFALDRAVVLISAMVRLEPYPCAPNDHYAGTAFGVTSGLVARISDLLASDGAKRLTVFSANGTGGEAFERFVTSGLVSGALDITLSELSDELCGGALSAGPRRGWGAVSAGLPVVMAPGALDFINYGSVGSVPEERRGRPMVRHTQSVTLVRTTAEENYQLGLMVGERATSSERCAVVVPTRGFSILSSPAGPFWDPHADDAFVQGLKTVPNVRLVLVDDEMNGPRTAETIVGLSRRWKDEE